jgi:hypothetical protein
LIKWLRGTLSAAQFALWGKKRSLTTNVRARLRLPNFSKISAITAFVRADAEGFVMAYLSLPRRIATLLTMSTVLASCSVDGLVPPADVDGTTRVGAISRNSQETSQQPMVQQPMPQQSMQQMANPEFAQPDPYQTYGAGPTTLEAQHQQMSGGSLTQVPQGEGVNIDAMVGANSQPVIGLAQEQQYDIAEGYSSGQPVVGNIGGDYPVTINSGAQGNADYGYPSPAQANVGMPRAARSTPQDARPQEVAMIRPDTPLREPQMSRAPAMLPQSELACRAELRRLGVGFKDVARISNGGSCGIDYPLELSGLAGGVAIKPSVKLNCQVTLAFAKWVKFELTPSARYRYLSGVGRITPMGGYSCRKMNSRSSNPWSEHARGNAIDIGTITLKNGKTIDVRKKSFFSFREKGLLKAVRNDSCKYFSTVLGPGSDPSHWNHFHFDLRTRKSGYRHCD